MVAPDFGGIKRVRALKKKLAYPAEIAVVNKDRPTFNQVKVTHLLGNVSNRVCFVIDDIIDTGGTIVEACKILRKHGAREVYVFACHPLLSGKGVHHLNQALTKGIIKKIFLSDTLSNSAVNQLLCQETISAAPLIANYLRSVIDTLPLSDHIRID